MNIELSNTDRKYLGLPIIEKHWEKIFLNENIELYFDGETIKKAIIIQDDFYLEKSMNEKTIENRTKLLPKTKRGKEKKLNYTSFSSRNGIGVYFRYSNDAVKKTSNSCIANYTTQKTFYTENFNSSSNHWDSFRNWLNKFIQETNKKDIVALNNFSKEKRKRVKYKQGDFFKFKLDRHNYGYGRILFDVHKYRKKESFQNCKNYGFVNLMGAILVVKIYHLISDKEINIQDCINSKCFPSQYIMDNNFYYGEHEIIGNIPIESENIDFPISYGRSISALDPNTVYLQNGLQFKECAISEFDKYLLGDNPYGLTKYSKNIQNPFRNESTGYGFNVDKEIIEKCIQENSNVPFWNRKRADFFFDLRNPINKKIKSEIFKFFKIDD